MKIVADINIPYVQDCLGHLGEVTVIGGRAMTAEAVRDADALLVRSVTHVNAALLDGSRVKFVGTATIGFDHVDREYLSRRDIGFSSAPGSNANSVAEYITAAMHVMAGRKGFKLAGKSLGIVGVGNVGSRVRKKAMALGMKVVLNDPPLQRLTKDGSFRPLEEILECDFVTMHVPLEREGHDRTWHMADEDFFASMKAGAVFMNSSRGGVVRTDALVDALSSGRISAVLDVWENEPNINTGLLNLVDIATPHIAGYSFDGKVAGMIMIYEALCAHFGLRSQHAIADFLPEPPVPVIELDGGSAEEQELVHTAVSRVYDIMADDAGTRLMLTLPPEQQGKHFDELRKNYPQRREFQNTVVELTSASDSLRKTLHGIGFKVRD